MTEEQPPEREREPWIPRPLAIGLTVVIAAVWVANAVVGYFDPARASVAVNAAFTIVLGLIYGGSGVIGRARRRASRVLDRDRERPAPDDERSAGGGAP